MDIVLDLKEIVVNFDDRIVLDNLSYSFSNGIYVITGPSGIGKTTLLNVISGYLKPAKGKTEFDSEHKVAYCMQEDLCFSNLTVKENFQIKCIALGREDLYFNEQIVEVLSKFKIEKLLESKVCNLSGGEKQRLKMAMMLIDSPSIILLDEPTSMLDEANKKELIQQIEQVWKDKILIISSHDELGFTGKINALKLEKGKLYEKE